MNHDFLILLALLIAFAGGVWLIGSALNGVGDEIAGLRELFERRMHDIELIPEEERTAE